MRPILFGSATFVLLTVAALGQPANAALEADGITAKIEANVASIANTIYQGDANGNIQVKVTIYQKLGGVWQEVSQGAALRVFTWGDNTAIVNADTDPSDGTVGASASASFNGDWTDRLNIPFTSQKGGTFVTFPKSALANSQGTGQTNGFDLFVTFSNPSGHTSHHSETKNRAIWLQEFDQADQLDYEGTTYAYVV